MFSTLATGGVPTARGNSARFLRAGLAGVLIVGTLPRLYGLSDRSLWFDEAFCWRLIQFPFFEMFERVARDNHPPLYFILLKVWAALVGDSTLALRSLSVLFGLTTLLGTYFFAAEVFGGGGETASEPTPQKGAQAISISRGQAIGLLSAALVASSAFQIRYSWEARMYALAASLAVSSSWALVRALHAPGKRGRWLLYGCLAILLAYTHYYGLFTLVAQGVVAALFLWHRAGWNLLALFRQQHFRYAVLTGTVVLLAWLPWLPIFLRQRAQVKEAFWTHPVAVWDVAELCYQMFLRPEYLPAPPRQHLLWVLDFCILGLYLIVRRADWRDGSVLILGLGPLGICLLASAWDVPTLSLRYFVPAHVFLLVALAALVWRIRLRLERTIAAAALVCTFVAVDFDFWETMDLANKPGSRGAAAFLGHHRKGNEPVVASMPFVYFSLLHDAPEPGGYYLFTDAPMPHYYGTAAMKSRDLIGPDDLKAINSRRVWVVDLDGGFLGYHAVRVPQTWAQTGQRSFADVFDLGNVIVIEYDTEGR